MILPITAGVIPFAVLVFKNYLDNVPNELLEAAQIDGAGPFMILRKIILPLSISISVVVVIWTFLMTWNDYFTAFACLVIISIPVMLLYLFLQKYIEDGITSGSIKN